MRTLRRSLIADIGWHMRVTASRRGRKTLTQRLRQLKSALPQATVATLNTYGDERRRYFSSIVSQWSGKPRFNSTVRNDGELIQLIVEATGEHRNKWYWVDRGTGKAGGFRDTKYPIEPKGDYPLRFMSNYTPYTSAPARYGGSGIGSGDQVRAFKVMHPGITPREFTKETTDEQLATIIDDIRQKFYEILAR